jgi:hypothetical protein
MSTARKNALQLVHYLRFKVNYNDNASGVAALKQTLPAGAIVLRANIYKTAVVNAGTTATLSIGLVGGTGTELVNAADVKTATGLAAGTLSGNALAPLAADTQVNATLTTSGTAPSAGAVYAVIEYVADNDLNAGQ